MSMEDSIPLQLIGLADRWPKLAKLHDEQGGRGGISYEDVCRYKRPRSTL